MKKVFISHKIKVPISSYNFPYPWLAACMPFIQFPTPQLNSLLGCPNGGL